MDKENTPQQKLDYTLLFIIFLMAIVSAIAIQSAQPFLPANLKNINFVGQQIQWYVIGTIAIIGTMVIDFDRFKMISWYLYGFGMLLLFGLFVEKFIDIPFATTNKGATSWYNFGFASFQPSELMKIIIIIVLSKIIADHREKYPINTVKDDLLLIGKIMLASAPPIGFLVLQPDIGMTMVFMSIIATLILVAGIKWRIIFTVLFTAVFAISVGVFLYFKFPDFFFTYIIKDYQMKRFYGWLDPYENASNEGLQLIRSLLAIGSGQLNGKGFQESEVTIPEGHTDFIFAVVAEQFGFVGTSIIISLFFLLIYRMIHIALESHDPFGSYLCAGVIGMITFQVFQNVGMTIQILPITGLPLPFISYGGSSLATYMIAIGIVLNVRSRTKKFMFD